MHTPFAGLDPLQTIRTEEPEVRSLLPTLDLNQDSKNLSQHERKEAEIY